MSLESSLDALLDSVLSDIIQKSEIERGLSVSKNVILLHDAIDHSLDELFISFANNNYIAAQNNRNIVKETFPVPLTNFHVLSTPDYTDSDIYDDCNSNPFDAQVPLFDALFQLCESEDIDLFDNDDHNDNTDNPPSVTETNEYTNNNLPATILKECSYGIDEHIFSNKDTNIYNDMNVDATLNLETDTAESMHKAVFNADFGAVEELLKIHPMTFYDVRDRRGNTPLLLAVKLR